MKTYTLTINKSIGDHCEFNFHTSKDLYEYVEKYLYDKDYPILIQEIDDSIKTPWGLSIVFKFLIRPFSKRKYLH